MIHKNTNYFAINNVTLVEFGTGHLTIVAAKGIDHSSLLMRTDANYLEIGADIAMEKGSSSNDFKPEVALQFTKPESIDVLIEELLKCKEFLIQSQEEHNNG